jgi:DNA repair protein RAD50
MLQLCGEKEVLAQVKLSFKGTSGAKLVVTRSLQLTVKKTTRQQKSLEAQLLMIKDGERTTISSRVAELDQIMPQYLGVSEAILDSVIFCHQDESLWPMSEPGVLKKRFDEIFAAMKYTKAIDNIKALRKTQGAELVKHKMFEDQFKIDKDRGERAEKQSLALQSEIEKLREQSEQLNRDMQVALDSAREKHQQSVSFLGIISELNTKRERAELRQQDVNDLRKDLEELGESDDWLKSTLAQYEEQMIRYRNEEQSYQDQYRESQKELEQARKRLASKLAEQGQYQAEKENYERQVELRSSLVKEAARRHAMRGYDGDLNDDHIREFMERVGKLSIEKARELERVQKATEDGLHQVRGLLNDLENRRSTRTQDKVVAKQTIAANDKKIYAIQNDVDDINIDEGAKAVLDLSLKDLKDRLRKTVAGFEESAWDKQLHIENAQLRELEEENERLNNELISNTRLASSRAQLEFVKKELKDKQRSLDTMIATYGEKISSTIGSNWQISTLEREFQAILDRKSRALADAQRQRDGTGRELEQIEFKLSTTRDARKKKTAEMKICQDAVLRSIFIDGQPLSTIDDYLSEMTNLESDRDTLKSDVENFTHLNDFYSKCIIVAEQQGKCRLCDRKFVEAREKSSAIAKLRQRLAEDNRAAIAAELQKVEDDLKEAQAARSQYEAYKRLSDIEIPALEKDLKRNEDQRVILLASLEDQDAIVRQEESAKREVESLSKTISTITRYSSEISSFDAEVATLSTQHKSSGNSLSLEEIQERLAACGEQARGLKAKIAKITSEKDRMTGLINSLELEVRDGASKLTHANHEIEKKQGHLSRIQDLKENSRTQHDSIQRADADLEILSPQISKAKAQEDDIKQRGRDKEQEIREESSRLSRTVNKLRDVDDAIKVYLENDGLGRLTACQRSIKSIEQDIARVEGELSEITLKANRLKEKVNNSERTKRTISDNLKFRQNLHELEVLHEQIAELESRNATEDYNRLVFEAQKFEMRHQKLLAERGPILGTMRAKDDELQRLLTEWETDYKDAARKYREAHIKVETTKAAIEDLGRYGTALDQAIMKYHSMKMEEINRIAGELWQSTYQGTDVDTILIRSDVENASNKRNFNYRVCMVKQDAEMDMRGRCSAGQRVLASIIIRLALAECFGVNCGVRISSISRLSF